MIEEIGCGISAKNWRVKFGLTFDEFYWTPGMVESGSASPAHYFNAAEDHYWKWQWLWVIVYFYGVGKPRGEIR